MTQSQSNRWALDAQYFLYFGVMGVFLPYFNLYCYDLGFSGWQIGTLSAVRSIVLVVFSIAWGLVADRFQKRRQIYILCNFISAALWGLFLLTTSFAWMLAAIVAYGIFYSPLISFLEAFAMEVLGKEKRRYGRMRAWGSLAFIVVVLLLGRFIEVYSIKIIISLVLALSWVQALVALSFPKVAISPPRLFDEGMRRLFNRRVALFLSCAFLMLVSHGAYYAFFSIHLARLGYDGFFIGLCWAVGVAAEIVAMYSSPRIFKRFSYESVLTVSFAVAALRWTGLWLIDSAPGILLLQLTHAMTYGTFHMASILYMDVLAPPGAKTIGQAVNNAVTYGLGLMVGFFLSGALYEIMPVSRLFAVSALFAVAGGLIFRGFVSARRANPQA